MDPESLTYNPSANIPVPETCVSKIRGCQDSNGLYYVATANVPLQLQNGEDVCQYRVLGCTVRLLASG